MDSSSKKIQKRTHQLQIMMEESKQRLEDTLRSATKVVVEVMESNSHCSPFVEATIVEDEEGEVSNERKSQFQNCTLGARRNDCEEIQSCFDALNTSKCLSEETQAKGVAKTIKSLEINNEKVECTESARRNACEEFHPETGILNIPESLFNDIKSKGMSMPLVEREKIISGGNVHEPMLDNMIDNGNTTTAIGLDLDQSEISTVSTNMCNQALKAPKSYANILTRGKVAIGLGDRVDMELKEISYIARKAGVPRIALEPDEIAMKRFENCLVGYFLCEEIPYYKVRNEIFRLWGKVGLKRMSSTESGFYFFEFNSDKARTDVLEKGLCYVFGKLLVLKKWHLMLSLTKSDMGRIPVWVRLHNLPYEFWSSDNLSKIASIIGRPLYADQATEKMLRVTYARVCIEIDAFEELHKIIEVEYGGQIVVVEVDYQGVPDKCNECKIFGHNYSSCPKNPLKTDDGKKNPATKPVHKVHLNGHFDMGSKANQLQWRVTRPRPYVGPKEDGKSDVHSTDFIVQKPKKMHLKDRNGKIATVQDVKKLSATSGKDKVPLKNENAFDILASLEDENKGTCLVDSKFYKNGKSLVSEGSMDLVLNNQDKGMGLCGVTLESKNSVSNVASDLNKRSIKDKFDVEVKDEGSGLDKSIDDKLNFNESIAEAIERLHKIKNTEFASFNSGNQPKDGSDLCSDSKVRDKSSVDKDRIQQNEEICYVNLHNPELDNTQFKASSRNLKPDAGIDDCELSTPNAKVGLVASDYPESMSKKQIKKRIKAAKYAYSSKTAMSEEPT